jgi:hypothetical protein
MRTEDEDFSALFQVNPASLNWKESLMHLYCAKDGAFTGDLLRDPQGFSWTGLN